MKQDFILLCGDLYQLLKTNYQIDYEIILKRKDTYIQLNNNKTVRFKFFEIDTVQVKGKTKGRKCPE